MLILMMSLEAIHELSKETLSSLYVDPFPILHLTDHARISTLDWVLFLTL